MVLRIIGNVKPDSLISESAANLCRKPAILQNFKFPRLSTGASGAILSRKHHPKGDEGDNARIQNRPKERAGHRLKAARIVRGKFTPELPR
jgi:hypothetical protein